MSDLKPLAHKKVAIIQVAAPKLDSRLFRTVGLLKNLGAEIGIFNSKFIIDGVVPPELGIDLGLPTKLRASEHPNWLARVAYNKTIFPLKEALREYKSRHFTPARLLADLRYDLYWFIGVASTPILIEFKKISKAPLIYEAYEHFPALLQSKLYFEDEAKNARYFELESQAVKLADKVIVVNEEIAEAYAHIYSIEKPEVIVNFANGQVKESSPLSSPLEFYYQSYLRPGYQVGQIIESFSELKGPAKLTIQGRAFPPAYLDELKELIIRSARRDDISLLPETSFDESVAQAARYDVGLCVHPGEDAQNKNESLRLALPNKLFTYASAGLALIANDGPAILRVVEPFRNAHIIGKMTRENVRDGMQWALDNPERIQEMKAASLEMAKEYSPEKVTTSLARIYADILGGA